MSEFNTARMKSLLAGIVLLGAGFAGGYITKPEPPIVPTPTPTPVAMSEIGPGPCYHVDGSIWMCPGIRDLGIAGDRLFLRGDSITVGPISVTYRDSTYVLPVPRGTDAIFFTPKAAEILVEHYKATDRAKATELQKRLDALPKP